MFHVYIVPRPGYRRAGLVALKIDGAEIWTDGTGVVEPHTNVDRQPVTNADGVGCKRRGGDELTADV